MKKVLNPNFQAGSATCNEPRLVGDILAEMLSSDSLFVKAFRHCTASHEDAAAEGQADDARSRTTVSVVKGWYRNTDLCMDVKTFLRDDRYTKIGKDYTGLLRRDSDDHYLFVETEQPASAACKRNPRLFEGKYISVTRRLRDGHVRFNFKEVDFGGRFNPMSFAIGVMKEIIMAFKCLGEEADWRAEKESTGD